MAFSLPVPSQRKNEICQYGWLLVLSWVDTAAAICAQRHTGKIVVTASIDSMHFLQPIQLGWIVSIKGSLNATAKTSCEVGIKITAENPRTQEIHHTASAYLTMVALDQSKKPTTVPKIYPETPTEKRRNERKRKKRKH